MNKQDRQGARTPADLERKYNFEQSFAEVMGIATDARTLAENVGGELTKEVARIDQTIKAHEASIGIIVDNGEVQGSIIIEAINNESSAKISADKIDIEGKELNIKVDATNITGTLIAEQIDATDLKVDAANIEGTLTAEQIDANGIVAKDVDITGTVTAKEGSIGGWEIGNDLTATTETTGSGIIQTQTVTFSTKGVEVTAMWKKDSAWTGPTPTFPSGVTIGQEYNKFVSWAELLKVWE